MAGTYIEKIVYGMDKIHLAKIKEDGTYDVPQAILGAKSVECSFEIAEKNISADNKIVYNSKKIANGTGTLEVLGLTADEKRLIMGDTGEVGMALRSGQDMPSFALLFAQQKADGGEILSVLYNVKFSPMSVNAVTLEEGQVEEQIATLEFQAIEKPNDNVFFFCVDSKEAGAEGKVQAWFTDVQEPNA